MADTFEVVRTATIDAPPELVMEQLVDFHKWQAWSPWEGLDPDQARTYSGSASGVGAQYGWKGNRKVGEGSMEITEVQPSNVTVDLRFIKPFKSQNVTRFDLGLSGASTHVTWTMIGPKNVATRIMGLFKSMDNMIGPDFEKGLAALKSIVEAERS